MTNIFKIFTYFGKFCLVCSICALARAAGDLGGQRGRGAAASDGSAAACTERTALSPEPWASAASQGREAQRREAAEWSLKGVIGGGVIGILVIVMIFSSGCHTFK